MIERHIKQELIDRLGEAPAVALLGPRQVGKTSLAQEVGDIRPSIYLDLESDTERTKLTEPELYSVRTKTSWSSSMRFTVCRTFFRIYGGSSTGADAVA